MKKIKVTVEVSYRYYEEVEITDEEYEDFLNGDIQEDEIEELDLDDLFWKCRNGYGDDDTDYAICGDDDVTIVDWD